jgi:hypothetical protein
LSIKAEEDLKESAKFFQELIWPEIKDYFGECKLTPAEGADKDSLASHLDLNSGIDYFIMQCNRGADFLASRIQYDKNRRTFTIRKERASGVRTEYDKLCDALDGNMVRPKYFSHAYIIKSPPRILGGAICNMDDLITHIRTGKEGKDYIILDVTKNGAARFYVVKWIRLKELGIPVTIWPDELAIALRPKTKPKTLDEYIRGGE